MCRRHRSYICYHPRPELPDETDGACDSVKELSELAKYERKIHHIIVLIPADTGVRCHHDAGTPFREFSQLAVEIATRHRDRVEGRDEYVASTMIPVCFTVTRREQVNESESLTTLY